MFDTVIVPLDLTGPGDRSIPVADALAVQGAAGLELVHVHPVDAPPARFAEELARRTHGLRSEAPATRMVASEFPLEAIGELAGPGRALCLSTHQRTLAGQFLHGSVSATVASAATEPLVLVGPCEPGGPAAAGGPGRYETVVACLDGSSHADAALAAATALAVQLGAGLELLAVAPLGGSGMYGLDLPPEVYLARQAAHAVTAGATEVATTVEEGAPAPRISARAADLGPGCLLVVSTHGLTGLSRAVLGSVAAQVIREAPAPVLLVPRHAGR